MNQVTTLKKDYLLIYIAVMYRDTELIILNFSPFNVFGTFNKGFINLVKNKNQNAILSFSTEKKRKLVGYCTDAR